MAAKTKSVLKTFFETGDFPTQEQFADLIDSLFHINDDNLPINRVTGLQALLDGLVQAAPITGAVSVPTNITLTQAQLVREVVLWSASNATLAIRLNGDSSTDQPVSLVANVRTVVLINSFLEATSTINIIDPSALVNYRIYRTF